MSLPALEVAASLSAGALFQGKDIEGPLDLSCDVVVVGSGAGGGAVAHELSEAGLEVIVLEEGGYNATKDFTPHGPEMIKRLYRDAGTNIIFGKPDIIFSEGRTVGGSTVINGGLTWRTPAKILKRWLWEHGLPKEMYSERALDPIFERVEEMISAKPQNEGTVGRDSHRIKEGCDALGYTTSEVKRNQHDCMGSNQCIFGCPTGAKQSTLVSYLPRAIQNGARIYADTKVQRVLVDRRGTATGVRATVTNPWTGQTHRCRVNANAVVVCAGAIQTPVLLQASGIGNRWVGRNLLVHPNVKALGIYEEEIYGWQGTIQGYQVDEFIDEGILMATTFIPPSLIAMTLPQFGLDLMRVMEQLNHMVVAGVLVEDTITGRVRRGPGGQAIMTYRCTPRDIETMMRGLCLLAEIYFAGGAKKVLLPIDGFPELESPDDIRKLFEYQPVDGGEIECFTVHAMGTAKIGKNEKQGACDPNGQLYGHPGVYVADASVFPSPIGVNPQVTIMALATQVAWQLRDRLRKREV